MGKKNTLIFVTLLIVLLSTSILLGVRNVILRKNLQEILKVSYLENIPIHIKKVKEKFPKANIIMNENINPEKLEHQTKVRFVKELEISEYSSNEKEYNFFRVNSIVVDSTGNIYLTEHGSGEITIFDSTGKFLSKFGRPGKGPYEFGEYIHLFFDNYNLLNVYDLSNQRISIFNTKKELLNTYKVATPFLPTSFIKDKNKNYYLSYFDLKNETVIHKYDSTGKYLLSFGTPIKYKLTNEIIRISLSSNYYCGKLLLNNDIIFFTQRNPYQINRFNLQGRLLDFIYRENDFMFPPPVKIKGNAFGTGSPAKSICVLIVHDKLVNFINIPENPFTDEKPDFRTVIDVFSLEDGSLISSIQLNYSFWAKTVDNKERIYGVEFEDEIEKIVGYDLQFINPD